MGTYNNTHKTDYCQLWEQIVQKPDCAGELLDQFGEQTLLEMMQHYGPSGADWVIEGDLAMVCEALVVPAYARKCYTLAAWIYAIGYDDLYDPLCGQDFPLLYAAQQNNTAFAEALLSQWEAFGVLTFDGDFYDERGNLNTLPELLVLADDVDVVKACISHGLDPNAFCYDGNRLLDISSEKMAVLLQSFGAVRATPEEKHLLQAVKELRQDCLRRNTVNAYFSSIQPLLELSWYNGHTPESKQQTANILLEAAASCDGQLLWELHTKFGSTLDDACRREILQAILGMNIWSPRRILIDRPIDIAKSLEQLYEAGVCYQEAPASGTGAYILDAMKWACMAFSFRDRTPKDIQWRAYNALYNICGTPTDNETFQRLYELAAHYPLTCLKEFVSVKMNAALLDTFKHRRERK